VGGRGLSRGRSCPLFRSAPDGKVGSSRGRSRLIQKYPQFRGGGCHGVGPVSCSGAPQAWAGGGRRCHGAGLSFVEEHPWWGKRVIIWQALSLVQEYTG
jgi:hypothetical protein